MAFKNLFIFALWILTVVTLKVDRNSKTKSNNLLEIPLKKHELSQKDLEQIANVRIKHKSKKQSKSKQDPAGSVDLSNIQNQQYVGQLYVGNPPQSVDFLFDTGSSLPYIIGDRCKDCPQSQKLMHSDSRTFFQTASEDSAMITLNYGIGMIQGIPAQDSICFDRSSHCFSNISFVDVRKGSDLDKDKFSGIIGLAPGGDSSSVPAFLSQISNGNSQGFDPTFSFYMSRSDSGKLVFGGYDLAKYAKSGSTESNILWSNQDSSSTKYWQVEVQDVRFGTSSMFGLSTGDDSMSGRGKTAGVRKMALDTGLSYAIVPTADLDKIKNYLSNVAGVKCEQADYQGQKLVLQTCSCPSSGTVPDMKIVLQSSEGVNRDFTITGDQLLHRDETSKCNLLFMGSNDFGSDKWIMGDLFLINYYSIYDYKNKRVGLVESKN